MTYEEIKKLLVELLRGTLVFKTCYYKIYYNNHTVQSRENFYVNKYDSITHECLHKFHFYNRTNVDFSSSYQEIIQDIQKEKLHSTLKEEDKHLIL